MLHRGTEFSGSVRCGVGHGNPYLQRAVRALWPLSLLAEAFCFAPG